MRITASAIALSVRVRAAIRDGRSHKSLTDDLERTSNLALGEIKERSIPESGVSKVSIETLISLPTESGNFEIGLAASLLDFVRKLYRSQTDDEISAAMQVADDSLNRWEMERRRPQIHPILLS
jgi:hypothetical protein